MLKSAEKFLRLYFLKHRATDKRTVIEINNYSFNIINSSLRLRSFFPLSSWTISPTALLHTLNYISTYKPKVIVEFGMGSSTLYISKLIEQNKLNTVLYSIDHNKSWIEKIESWLQTEELTKTTRLIHVPLTDNFSFQTRAIQWYDLEVLDASIPKDQVELLLVDAPPAAFLYSRAGALIYFSKEIQEAKLNYFFDDANRKEEKKILQLLGANNLYFLDYAVGGNRSQPFETVPISLYK